MLLVDRRGELVTRDEMVARLWGRDVFIDVDSSVNTVIRKIDVPCAIPPISRDSSRRSRARATASSPTSSRPLGACGSAVSESPSANGDQDYVADGLTEETIVGLGQIDPDRLSVIGRTSSMAYRRTRRALGEMGRELGADYSLEGSVAAPAGRLRVAAKLIRVRAQVQAWTWAYERESADLRVAGGARAGDRPAESSCGCHHIAPRDRGAADEESGGVRSVPARPLLDDQMTPATAARALECFRAPPMSIRVRTRLGGHRQHVFVASFDSDTRRRRTCRMTRGTRRRWRSGTAKPWPRRTPRWGASGSCSTGTGPAPKRICSRAVALDPGSGQTHWMLGEALSQQQRHDRRSRRRAGPVSSIHATRSATACPRRSRILPGIRGGGAPCQDALRAEPDFWVAHWQLGTGVQRMGRTERRSKR